MSDSLVHAMAGATGGVVSMALTYPLITLSTRSQVNSKEQRLSQLETLKQIIKEEGIAGLYSGVNSALFGISVTSAIYYYWYELVKSKFQLKHAADEAITVLENMITGTIAGTITSVLTNPIWLLLLTRVINTRLLVKNEENVKKQSIIEAFNSIKNEEGIKGFWRGLGPALILVSNPVIQYTVFERLRVRCEQSKKLSPIDILLLGALAKLCATSITYPYIVVMLIGCEVPNAFERL